MLVVVNRHPYDMCSNEIGQHAQSYVDVTILSLRVNNNWEANVAI